MKLLMIAVLGIAACIGAYIWLAPQEGRPKFLASDAEKFCRSCEKVLSERLKSPSSYERLSCDGPLTRVMSEKEYLEFHPNKKAGDLQRYERQRLDNGEYSTSKFLLKYEAANSYGANIAGAAVCDTRHTTGKTFIPLSELMGVRVNGYTSTDWVFQKLIKSQGVAN